MTVRHRNGGIRKRCGCPRRKWTTCPHPWHANLSIGGVEHRVSLHKWAKKPGSYVMLKSEAERLWHEWRLALVTPEPVAPTPAPVSTLTLDALADAYLIDFRTTPGRRPTAIAEATRQVRVLTTSMVTRTTGETVRLGSLPCDAITDVDLEAWRMARWQAHEAAQQAAREVAALQAAERPVPATLTAQARLAARSEKAGRVATNRLLTRCSTMFAFGIKRRVIQATPFVTGGVRVITPDRAAEHPRTRRLEGDEEARLLAAAGDHLHDVIVCILETGMRPGEVLGLQWRDVQQDRGVMVLPATLTKTGKPRAAIISPPLDAVLVMRRTRHLAALDEADPATAERLLASLYVFGTSIGERVKSVRTAFRAARRRAGIDAGLHLHDLRRESGSALLEAGVPVHEVRDYLGHQSIEQTNVYLSTTIGRLKEAVARREDARKSRTNLAHTASDAPAAASEAVH